MALTPAAPPMMMRHSHDDTCGRRNVGLPGLQALPFQAETRLSEEFLTAACVSRGRGLLHWGGEGRGCFKPLR